MRIALKNHLSDKVSDAMVMSMGHTHKLLVRKPISRLYMVMEDGRIRQKYTSAKKDDGYIHPDYRWYVNTGSFYKLFGQGFSGYAERKGYSPIELGFAVLEIRGGKPHDVKRCVCDSGKLLIFSD
jgi:hypothetical protein